ncbi:MAG: hydroxyacylglutathione hydrolase [Myxococcales bacterium]|nr:hydroxyacylglutathione hydrolase [Myxococcales bacterium]
MKSGHVVQVPNEPALVCNGRLTLHQIPSAHDNLIWLLVCNETGDCAAVDGPDGTAVAEYCTRHNFRLTKILNTHTHPDHIGINRDFERQGLLGTLRVFGSEARQNDIPGITDPVGEGDTVSIGVVSGDVWLTEGHLDGHISYLFDDILLCGDTLFAGGCGYLFDGPPQKMYDSLMRFSNLAPMTKVCCAHEYTLDNLLFARSVEPKNRHLTERLASVQRLRHTGRSTVPSTIEIELMTNPFLRSGSLELRAHVLTPANQNATDAEVFAKTRELKDQKLYKTLDLEK